MAEYIDRDALCKKLKETAKQYTALKKLETAQDYWWAMTVIDSEPAADIAEVVWCKDCDYFGLNDENVPYCSNPFGLDDPEPNGFCNYRRNKNVD